MLLLSLLHFVPLFLSKLEYAINASSFRLFKILVCCAACHEQMTKLHERELGVMYLHGMHRHGIVARVVMRKFEINTGIDTAVVVELIAVSWHIAICYVHVMTERMQKRKKENMCSCLQQHVTDN